jgi:hypothetical protein
MDMFGGGVIVMVTEKERRRKVSNFNFALINIFVVFLEWCRVQVICYDRINNPISGSLLLDTATIYK